jgi:hypothetical protein
LGLWGTATIEEGRGGRRGELELEAGHRKGERVNTGVIAAERNATGGNRIECMAEGGHLARECPGGLSRIGLHYLWIRL